MPRISRKRPASIVAGSDVNRTSTTTMADHAIVKLPLLANTTYKFNLDCQVTGTAGKVGITLPSGATSAGRTINGATVAQSADLTTVLTAVAAGCQIIGTITTGDTPGYVTLQTAQNSSSGTPTVVKASTNMEIRVA